MDTKSFVKILRKVIREEVSKAVTKALNENVISDKQVKDHGINLSEIAENPMPTRPYAKKKKFAKNSMINDLLNETAATGDFASMMEGPAVGMMDDYPQMGPTRKSQMVGIDGESVKPVTKELEAVNNAINKDYSHLIKAINKKNGKMGV